MVDGNPTCARAATTSEGQGEVLTEPWWENIVNPTPELLKEVRGKVIEWFCELQFSKPKTPSLSQLSFKRRQNLVRKQHRETLRNLHSIAEIVAFGCHLLKGRKDLLEIFLCTVTQKLIETPRPVAASECKGAALPDSASSESTAVQSEPSDLGPPRKRFRALQPGAKSICIDLDP